MKHDTAILADVAAISNTTVKRGSIGSYLTHLMGRMRFQVAGGFITAVVLPAVVRGNFEHLIDPVAQYDNSIIATLCAFLLGFIIFRKVTSFPGVRATAYLLPAFALAYVAIVFLFAMLRIEYSRYQLLLSAGLTVIFFYVIFVLARRASRLQIAVVPSGDMRFLREITLVDWTFLTRADAATAQTPLVADFRRELDPSWERFIADSALSGRPVYDARHVFESLSGRVRIEHLSENTFGTLIPGTIYGSAKRYFDFLIAMIAFVVLAPLLLLVGVLIRIDSPGPALFRQDRMGYRGKIFRVFKFRTMRVEPPQSNSIEAQMTKEDDPRITKLGRFLRRSRIDELPQMLNILRGEMSWIGPRPEAAQLSSWYEEQIPFYRYRHVVRPGITGWAQVNQGHVTSLRDVDLKLQYDFFYVKNFSLWLDILVFIRTLRIVFTGQGAK